MDAKRRGEIAELILKQQYFKQGKLDKDTRRVFGEIAKELNISLDEVLEFFEPWAKEAVDRIFAKLKSKDVVGQAFRQ